MKKKLIGAAVVIAVVGFIAFNFIRANQAEDDGIPRDAPPVHWAYPETQTIVSRVNARGTVELRDRTLVFPETQARILTLHVSVGDTVQAGDVLITYDDDVLQTLRDQLAQARLALRQAELGLETTQIGAAETEILAAENAIDQARASIANIDAQLDQFDLQISQARDNIATARTNLADTQFLYDGGIIPRIELDTATDALRRLEDQLAILESQRYAAALGLPMAQESERLAEAQRDAIITRHEQPAAVNQAQIQQVNIEQARLNIAQIQRNIADFRHEETAAVSGTVINIFAEEGEVSITGRPLLEIADISNENLVIVVHVPENDSGGIAVGQEVEISGGAVGSRRYEGYIELIHPIAAPRQMGTTLETVVTAEIALAEATTLRAGNTADADIITNISEDTLVVPLMSTISAGGGYTFVLAINDDSELERIDVTLGEFSAMYIEAHGVSPTHRIVSNPSPALHHGMIVRAVPSLDE